MKKFLFTVFLLALGILVFLVVGVFALTKSPLDNWQGTVQLNVVSPDVSVKQGNLEYQKISESIILAEGDMVKTGAQGEAEILLADGAIIRLANNTEVQINQATLDSLWEQNVNVSLNKGKIWFRIIKIFDDGSSWEVETPTVVATVRGTAFGVEVSGADDVDLLVAESEVFVTEKNSRAAAKQAVAVAGQRMQIKEGFEVLKDKLNLEDQRSGEIKQWVNKNLEKDRDFQQKVQQKMNAEILKNLKEEPGTLLHEAQLWAEKIRIKFADEKTKEKLLTLQDNRRLAETLWLAEKGEDKKLQDFLTRPELKDLTLPRLDKLPQLMIAPEANIKNLFNNQDLNNNVFDIKTLENNIQKLELNILPNKFDFNRDFNFEVGYEFLSAEDLAQIKRAMQWINNNPELVEQMQNLSEEFNNLPQNDMVALLDFVNSTEYLALLEEMGEKAEFDLRDNMDILDSSFNQNNEDWFVIGEENFKDFQLAMEWLMSHPEVQEKMDEISILAEKIDENDEAAMVRFLNGPVYTELLDMMEDMPGFIRPDYSELQIVEPPEYNELQVIQPNSIQLLDVTAPSVK